MKNPARYRLDFIKENTFNRVWAIRMTRTRVVLVTLAVLAAFGALIWCIMAYTPMRRLLPGTLRGDLRVRYVETALRLDSLEQSARMNEAYLTNLMSIMRDDFEGQSPVREIEVQAPGSIDSLLAATEAEKAFVQRYEDEARFNLSVLAPIAAEGMVFTTPSPTPQAVAAVYRGTVVGLTDDGEGRTTIIVQHPNDFVSVYEGLRDVYVDKGRKVAAGQRLGTVPAQGRLAFELWHSGTKLDPDEYISL